MRKFLLKTALPAFRRYVTGDGRLKAKIGLDTIPRVPLMPDEHDTLKGLNESGHYGLVRPVSRDYLHWLLESYFTPWAGAWLEASVYFWWVQTFTESGGGGGSLPWIRSILSADNRSVEDELHELAHFWEFAKVEEGLWTEESFTQEWLKAQPPDNHWALWARGFYTDVIAKGIFSETYASTGSYAMGDLGKLPDNLKPFYRALFL